VSLAGIRIEPVSERAWLVDYLLEHWGAPGVVSRGKVWTGEELMALRAWHDGAVVGVVSWFAMADSFEIVTLNSDRRQSGVGTALMDAAVDAIRKAGARRVRLITTNDNIDALRFYQRRGWCLVALHPGAIAVSRRLKPSVPDKGAYGIPIRDEIELEFPL